jgi:hypothetical protein
LAWLLPLSSLSLLSRVAASNLVDVLLPSAAPRARYALGAASLTIVGLAALAYALMFLDPLRQLVVAGVVAFGAPLLAFAVLGATPVAETVLPDWMKSPRLVFCWYLPLFALAVSGLLAWGAFELAQPGAVVLAGPLIAVAGLVPWWLAVRRGPDGDEARPARPIMASRGGLPTAGLRRRRRVRILVPGVHADGVRDHAVLETLRLAEAEVEHVSSTDEKAVGLLAETPGTSRILVASSMSKANAGSRLCSGWRTRRRASTGARMEWVWRTRSRSCFGLGILGWWAICRRTFGWDFERLAATSRGSADDVEGQQRDDLLAAVQKGELPAWLLSGHPSAVGRGFWTIAMACS